MRHYLHVLVTKEAKLSGWNGGLQSFQGPHACKAKPASQPHPKTPRPYLVFWAVCLWSQQHCSTLHLDAYSNVNREGISGLTSLGPEHSVGADWLPSTPAARKLPEVSPAQEHPSAQ